MTPAAFTWLIPDRPLSGDARPLRSLHAGFDVFEGETRRTRSPALLPVTMPTHRSIMEARAGRAPRFLGRSCVPLLGAGGAGGRLTPSPSWGGRRPAWVCH